MTYCTERTKLLAVAGRELARKLLPEPFVLWHSDHSTGIQMTIVTKETTFPPLVVWSGSIWHSHIYEFNDQDKIPGLQPDFEFARDVIDKYFADVDVAVHAREEERAQIKAIMESDEKNRKTAIIESVRRTIGGAS